ncbi:MAG: methyltransferase domain-containing protein [Sphingobacteriales bacterium]|nr:MAG: methyltransferase domain-containing protein [Sphingobacteriales bacterium]
MSLPLQDIIEWDVLNWSQLVPAWTPIIDSLDRNSKILAIGERNGGLSTWLALEGFNVICTDRTGPEPHAAALHRKHGVAHKIQYDKLDIVDCNWQPCQFDLIIAKSVIGGLKADPANRSTRTFQVQQQAVNNIHNLLKPGGYFLSAENMEGSLLLKQIRRIKNKDKGWRHFSWREMPALFKPFAEVKTKAFGVLPTLFSSPVVNRVVFGMNKYFLQILPSATKYISFTIARK